MKKEWIKNIAIALLLLWAIIATVCAVDNENRREKLFEENKILEQNYEDMVEMEKETIKEGYEGIIDVYKERNKELYDLYLKGLAYEMALDMSVSIVNGEDWDFYLAYAEIMTREGLGIVDMDTVTDYLLEITEGKVKEYK